MKPKLTERSERKFEAELTPAASLCEAKRRG